MADFSIGVVIGAALGSSYASTFSSAKKQAAGLGLALKETNRKLAASRDVIRYKSELDSLRQKQATLGRSSERLDRGIADLEKRYRQAKASAKGYGLEVGSIIRQEKALAAQSAKLARRQEHLAAAERAKGRLADIRGGLLGAGVGLAAVGSTISQAQEFEQVEVRLGTVINAEDTAVALRESRRHALDFARRKLADEKEILEIEYSLNSAGLSAQASRVGSEVVAKVAKVTAGASDTVGTIIGDTFSNIGDQLEGTVAQRLTRIGDVLTKTQFLFSIKDFGQLGESFKEGMPAILAYNVALEQGAAVLGQLNSAGLKGSQAGTAFNAMLRQISKGAKEFGFELVRTKDGQLDVIATLQNMQAALAGISDEEEKAARLQKAFGDEGKKGTVLLLNSLDKLSDGYRKVKDESAGVVDKSYQDFLDSSAGKTQRLAQTVSQLGTVFGLALLPAVNSVVGPLTDFVGWVASAVETTPVAAQVVGTLVGAVAAGATTLGVVTAATWAWNAALAANPVGLIVAGVVALGVGIYAVYKNWNVIWPAIRDGSIAVGKAVAQFFLRPFIRAYEVGVQIGATAKAMWPVLKAQIVSVGKVIWNHLVAPFKAARNLVGSVVSGVKGFFGGDEPKPGDAVRAQREGRGGQAARAAAAAGLIAAAPAAAAPAVQNTDNSTNTIQVYQQPGENPEALANRITEIQDRKRQIRMRGKLHDGGL